jgi:predicted small metal-binding protein
MFRFTCKDVGVNCNFTIYSSSMEDVKRTAVTHAEAFHKNILQTMTQEQRQELEKIVELKTHPAG